MKKMKNALSLLLCLLLTLSLCACGSSNSAGNYAKESSTYTEAAYFEASEAESADWDASEPGGLAARGSESKASEAPGINPDKIIYSASATLETMSFEETLTNLNALVAQYGGFIESSSVSGVEYRSSYRSGRSASYRIRVPSDRFQELMGSLATLGNVPYSSMNSENISSRYYDVETRVAALKAQEQRLLEMMEQADSISDLIEIEDRLGSLRYEIESYQTKLNSWDRQVSYSTVDLKVSEVIEYTPEPDPSFGQQLVKAAKTGWSSMVSFLRGLLIILLESLPVLIVLGGIAALVIVLVRKFKKARRAKKVPTPPAAEVKDEKTE